MYNYNNLYKPFLMAGFIEEINYNISLICSFIRTFWTIIIIFAPNLILKLENFILVLLRKRLISDGLEPVLRYTERSCTASNYRQFSTNINIKIVKLLPVSLARTLKKLVLIL